MRMFSKLADLGKALAEREGLSPPQLLCQGVTDPYNRAVELRFSADGRYLGASTRDLSPLDGRRLPFIEVHSSAPAFVTPICKFSGKLPNMLRRLRNCLEAIEGFANECNQTAESDTLRQIRLALESQQEQILGDLQRQQEQFADTDHRLVLYPCVVGSVLPEPIHDWALVSSWIEASLVKTFGEYERKRVLAQERQCCLCGQTRPVVYGNFSKLKTYILDQPGRIAGGLDPQRAARNFPVCPDCCMHASYGVDVALRDLSFRLFGVDYLIVPEADEPQLLLEFHDSAVRWREERSRSSLSEERLRRLTRDEREILDLIGEEFGPATNLSLTLVFFREKDAQWRILAEVPEVLPSWLARVYETKRTVESELPEALNVAVTLAVVRDATRQAQGQSNKEGDRLFLQWTEAILRGGKLDRRAVMRVVVDHILRSYREDARRAAGGSSPIAGFVALQGYLLVRLLEELNIIQRVGGGQMESLEEFSSEWSHYLQDRGEFFGRPEARVAFLTGALVRQVAWVQQRKRNLSRTEDAPIFKKVRGMRLNPARLQGLLSESKEKLLAYQADWLHRELQELLSSEWTQVGSSWDLSNDETTFYFTLGLNLSWHVSRPRQEEVEEGEAQ